MRKPELYTAIGGYMPDSDIPPRVMLCKKLIILTRDFLSKVKLIHYSRNNQPSVSDFQ